MRYHCSAIIVVFSLSALSSVYAKDPPRKIIEAAFYRVGGETGLITYPGKLRATFDVESYNDNDGLVRESIVEALGTFAGKWLFRSDHIITRPEQGPKQYHFSYYLRDNIMWEVTETESSGTFEGKQVSPNIETMRTFPHTLRVIEYMLGHRNLFKVKYKDHGDVKTGREVCHSIGLRITYNSEVMNYLLFITKGALLPIRVEYEASDTSSTVFVTEYKNWKRQGTFMLPAETRQFYCVKKKDTLEKTDFFYSIIKLISMDFSPEFDSDYFELPKNMVVKEKK